MNGIKHTPLRINDMPLPNRKLVRIISADNLICEIKQGKRGKIYTIKDMDEETRSFIEFIVRACNCHDELVRALDTAITVLEDIRYRECQHKTSFHAQRVISDISDNMGFLNKALAKAKGE
jgi:hypothetical protein